MYVFSVSIDVGFLGICRKPHLPKHHNGEKQPPVTVQGEDVGVYYTCKARALLIMLENLGLVVN